MDSTAAFDQIQAEIENGSAETRADIALAGYRTVVGDILDGSGDNIEAIAIHLGFASIFARQQVILDRLGSIEEKLDASRD